MTTTFTAISTGNISEIDRDFGDGTQGKGTTITHTFISPSMYNIQAIAKGNGTEAKAQVIVMVGGYRGDNKALQTRASVIGGKINTESTLSASVLGNFDEIEWVFPKENTTSKKLPGESLKRIFTTSGENFVLVK
ncbi:MAG: PKD domain-containing protein [bacterium]